MVTCFQPTRSRNKTQKNALTLQKHSPNKNTEYIDTFQKTPKVVLVVFEQVWGVRNAQSLASEKIVFRRIIPFPSKAYSSIGPLVRILQLFVTVG